MQGPLHAGGVAGVASVAVVQGGLDGGFLLRLGGLSRGDRGKEEDEGGGEGEGSFHAGCSLRDRPEQTLPRPSLLITLRRAETMRGGRKCLFGRLVHLLGLGFIECYIVFLYLKFALIDRTGE